MADKLGSTSEINLVVDPPYGWHYGFPKIMPKDVQDTKAWLVANGYPQKLIDEYGEHFYVRYWTEREQDVYQEE